MAASRHLDNASKIIAECMVLKDGVLVAKNNGFLDIEIEGNCKVIINYTYNKKKSNLPSSIILLMNDI